MKFPNVIEIAPSESGYPIKDYSFKPKNDNTEFKERFNKHDSYFQYLFKKGAVSIWTKNRRYFCKDGVVYCVNK